MGLANFSKSTLPTTIAVCAFCALGASASTEGEKLVFEIDANTAPCVGVAPMRCLIVNGEYFYESIAGYRHIEGTAAKICVLRSKRPEPVPADLGVFSYSRITCED
jgi:hypothetical protein